MSKRLQETAFVSCSIISPHPMLIDGVPRDVGLGVKGSQLATYVFVWSSRKDGVHRVGRFFDGSCALVAKEHVL